MASFFPSGAEGANLGGLSGMERLTGLIEFEGRRFAGLFHPFDERHFLTILIIE
jgi:hypothetical protein